MRSAVSAPRRCAAGTTRHSSRCVTAKATGDVDVAQALTDAASSTVKAVAEATPAPQATSAPAAAVDTAVEALSKAAAPATPAVSAGPGVGEITNDLLVKAESAVENFIDGTAEAFLDAIEGAGRSVTENVGLPANLQSKVDAISSEYADARSAFQEAPEVYLFLLACALGAVGYAYYKNEYGGYSGIYKPADLLAAVNNEQNVVIVDIRTEEEQARAGVLDLRRKARGCAVSLPPVQVPDAVKADIDNRTRLETQLRAALICSLANVNAFTRIVLIDTRGGETKPLAREIVRQGYRGYVCKGGYALWSRSGLPTKQGTYDITAADLISDKGEELREGAQRRAEELRKPENAAIVAVALATTVSALAYPHQTFQFLGFVGLELTILAKLLAYDSASAAAEDFTSKFGSLAGSAKSAASSARSAATSAASAASSTASVAQKVSDKAAAAGATAASAVQEQVKQVKEEASEAPEVVKKAPKAEPEAKKATAPVPAPPAPTKEPAPGPPVPPAPKPEVTEVKAAAPPPPPPPTPKKPETRAEVKVPAAKVEDAADGAPKVFKTAADVAEADVKPAPPAPKGVPKSADVKAEKKEEKKPVKADLAEAAAEAAAVAQEAVPKPVVDLLKEKRPEDASKNGNSAGSVESKAWPGGL